MLRFLLGKPGRWNAEEPVGLVIESGPPRATELASKKFASVFPGLRFDLLTLREEDDSRFRYVFHVHRFLGGIRLLLNSARYYHVVVFFACGEHQLRLCRAMALLFMRPAGFFAFNEFGDGFWVSRANLAVIRMHLRRRFPAVAACIRFAAAIGRVPLMFVRAAVAFARLVVAGVYLVPAFALLAVLRLCYDDRRYRFRLFSKTASAPRRDFSQERDAVSAAKTGKARAAEPNG
jgi:hypothetical protein